MRNINKHSVATKRYKEKMPPEQKKEYNRRMEFSRSKSFIMNKATSDELIEIESVLQMKREGITELPKMPRKNIYGIDRKSPEWLVEYRRRNEFSRTKSFIMKKSTPDEISEIEQVLLKAKNGD